MLTKKVQKRVSFLSLLLISLVIAVFFILKSLTNNILYFKSPTDIQLNQDIVLSKKMRVGGMVKKNSININDKAINFIITDFKNEINVVYSGLVPNLFQEGKGVVAEGFLRDKSFLDAKKILAKHDENYMPPEVKEALGEK